MNFRREFGIGQQLQTNGLQILVGVRGAGSSDLLSWEHTDLFWGSEKVVITVEYMFLLYLVTTIRV